MVGWRFAASPGMIVLQQSFESVKLDIFKWFVVSSALDSCKDDHADG